MMTSSPLLLAFYLWVGVILSVGPSVGQQDDPFIVDAGILGPIRGSGGLTIEENGERRSYKQFRGIPYANVTQRFTPSTLLEKPLTNNGDVFNATTTPLQCYQPFAFSPVILTEDCLFINIYTHQKDTGNASELRPVIFFIHGGAFTVGNGALFSGLRIMNRDIVLVTFNYRLGLLGFLSLQNEDVPGNAGLYDTLNALNWTRNFIQHFGGNPNNITIAGQSAGSVMVHHLMSSPLAQGLFHGAIGSSGSALNIWGTSTNPLDESLTVSSMAGCHNESAPPNYGAIAECMRQVDAIKLVEVLQDFQVYERSQGRMGFEAVAPVVQNFPMTTLPKFMPEHPRVIFETGRQAKVPLMMSSTKHDGSYVLGVFYNRFLKVNGNENNATYLRTQLIPSILRALNVEDKPAGIHESIGRMYLGEDRLSGDFQKMYPGLMDIFSVFFFKGDAYETAMLHSKVAPSYWYSFEFRGKSTFFPLMFPGGESLPPFPGGITHTDDLLYLFSLTFQDFTEEEYAVSSRMMSYWGDFATTGEPSSTWPALDPTLPNQKYLAIDVEDRIEESYQNAWTGAGYEAAIPTDPMVVNVNRLGRIRGSMGSTYEEHGVRRPYVQFRGIPYATVPERFSPSILLENPLMPDGDIFNATLSPPSCFQPFLPPPLLTEDCLTINIYSHQKDTGNEADLRPVLFFIHGGAFTVGNGASFSGARLMNRDIVYVSFNYRLGLMGFFSLQNEDVPGNAGMYDIVNALNWTSKYIQAFGGNPNNITIAGQSAGSVAVTHLLASPLARGLFHGAIGSSGTALSAWGVTTNPVADSLKVASIAGCYDNTTTPNTTEIATCMREADASILVDALLKFQVSERQQGRLGFSLVSPVVQDFEMTTHEKIVPEHPRVVFEEGRQAKVPLMMSCNKHDGSYVLGVFYNRYLKDNGLVNNATFLSTRLVPAILESLGIEDKPRGIHESIARMYLGEDRLSGNFQLMYPGLMDIFSVFFFKGDAYLTAKLHSEIAPTFWYSFDYQGPVSMFNSLFPGEVPPFPGGVTHMDDLIYLYGLTFFEFTPKDQEVSTQMINYWGNFTTNGKPSDNWPELSPNGVSQRYMSIGEEIINLEDYEQVWVGPGYETVIDTPEDPSSTNPTVGTTPGGTSTTNNEPSTPIRITTPPTTSNTPETTSEVPESTTAASPSRAHFSTLLFSITSIIILSFKVL